MAAKIKRTYSFARGQVVALDKAVKHSRFSANDFVRRSLRYVMAHGESEAFDLLRTELEKVRKEVREEVGMLRA